ncbi:hypothetical protein CKY04_10450 [Photorhabdus sp. S8-52]|nr:hypothetical protein CKY05_10365 [Photorhabdus sp. S10-54]RAW99339.1 hypothetical protein CKY03_09890 [Photorhabdus sp. S9-53]RAX03544.1 hypothetical protein CKY04_10450 [Photorhabdus sp. S8-52]
MEKRVCSRGQKGLINSKLFPENPIVRFAMAHRTQDIQPVVYKNKIHLTGYADGIKIWLKINLAVAV